MGCAASGPVDGHDAIESDKKLHDVTGVDSKSGASLASTEMSNSNASNASAAASTSSPAAASVSSPAKGSTSPKPTSPKGVPAAKPLQQRYTLGKVLGKGGFGEVREAIRKEDGKRCDNRKQRVTLARRLLAGRGLCGSEAASHFPPTTPMASSCATCRVAVKTISKLKFAGEEEHQNMLTEVRRGGWNGEARSAVRARSNSSVLNGHKYSQLPNAHPVLATVISPLIYPTHRSPSTNVYQSRTATPTWSACTRWVARYSTRVGHAG